MNENISDLDSIFSLDDEPSSDSILPLGYQILKKILNLKISLPTLMTILEKFLFSFLHNHESILLLPLIRNNAIGCFELPLEKDL